MCCLQLWKYGAQIPFNEGLDVGSGQLLSVGPREHINLRAPPPGGSLQPIQSWGLWVARPGHFCPMQATPPRPPRAFAGLHCTWLPLTVSPLPSQVLIPNKHLGIPNSVLTSASGNDISSFNIYKHCGRSDGNFVNTPQTPTWKGGSRSLSLYNNGSQPFCVLDILLNTSFWQHTWRD